MHYNASVNNSTMVNFDLSGYSSMPFCRTDCPVQIMPTKISHVH